MSSIERLQRVEKMTLMDQAKYSSIFSELANLKPIHKRVNNVEIELLLQKEFGERDLDLDFDCDAISAHLIDKLLSPSIDRTLLNFWILSLIFIRCILIS